MSLPVKEHLDNGGALLASNESIHIKGLVYNQEKELAKVIEVEALKKANMSNFLFMDDL